MFTSDKSGCHLGGRLNITGGVPGKYSEQDRGLKFHALNTGDVPGNNSNKMASDTKTWM